MIYLARQFRVWLPLLWVLVVGPTFATQSSHSHLPSSSHSSDFAAGDSAFSIGQFEQALKLWEVAAGMAEESGSELAYAEALIRKARALQQLGHYRDSLEELHSARQLLEETEHLSHKAMVFNGLGVSYQAIGDDDRANDSLRHSMDSALRAENFAIAAMAQNNLGKLSADSGKPQAALQAFREATRLAEVANDKMLLIKSWVNTARMALIVGRNQEVAALLKRAWTDIAVLDPGHDKAFLLINVGRLAQKLLSRVTDESRGDWRRIAFQAFTGAMEISERNTDLVTQAYAVGYLAKLYEDEKRYQEALDLTRRAVFLSQSINRLDILYRWQWQQGRLLKNMDDLDGAIKVYEQAIFSLQMTRQDQAGATQTGDSSFRTSVGPIYYELANLLLQRSRSSADVKKVEIDLLRARDFVEMFKSAELQDYFQDDCVASVEAKITTIDALISNTAVIYPILLSDRTELLVATRGGIHNFVVPVDSEQMTKTVRDFRGHLQSHRGEEYLTQAKQLYDWLLKPVTSVLEDNAIDTIIFVPDGALRTVPMAALHDGTDFLITRYAVATTPGLTLTDPRPLAEQQPDVLLSGLTEGVRGFVALPSVADELEAVHSIYGGKILVDDEFRKPNLEEALDVTQYGIVHVATHGKIESDVRKSYLLTYDSKLTLDDLERLVGYSRYSGQPIELLMLSACQTAQGDDRAALGLAGIAVKAGARSAVASLWFISDEATAMLVPEFYSALQYEKLSKAKALQQAQIKLLKSKRFHHPGFWSPFLLIGNWL